VVNSTSTNPGAAPALLGAARSRSGRVFNGIKSLGPRIRFPATWITLSSTIPTSMGLCASLSAHRGAAVLFKLLDVSIAAAQPVRRLVGGFCCAASFNAHGAERWNRDRVVRSLSGHRASPLESSRKRPRFSNNREKIRRGRSPEHNDSAAFVVSDHTGLRRRTVSDLEVLDSELRLLLAIRSQPMLSYINWTRSKANKCSPDGKPTAVAGTRMSRVPWNFGGGPVSIRLRSPRHCA
jgi:hypothetical protein